MLSHEAAGHLHPGERCAGRTAIWTEVYREATPPADYAIEDEVAAIERFAESKGLGQFHLVGYSGGGFISLAFAGTHPERLLSLGLFEPARIPGDLTPGEAVPSAVLAQKLKGLEGAEFMAAFVREQVKPGVELPPAPSGPISPEMQKRPAGIAAMIRAFDAYRFDRALLARAGFPVFLGYGDQTHPIESIKAGVLATLFGDIRVRRFAGVHHFVPPEQLYTAAHAESLLDLWRRGEARLAAQLSLQK